MLQRTGQPLGPRALFRLPSPRCERQQGEIFAGEGAPTLHDIQGRLHLIVQ